MTTKLHKTNELKKQQKKTALFLKVHGWAESQSVHDKSPKKLDPQT